MIEFIEDKNEWTCSELWSIAENSYLEGSPWSQEQFLESFWQEDIVYLGLKVDNYCIGFVHYRKIIDEVEIYHMVILKEYQKKGYGTLLLKSLLKKLTKEKCQQILLEVRSSNISAQRLYQKLGFERIMTRKNYYRHPKEDALVMQLKLRK